MAKTIKMAKTTTIYELYEREFNQPTFMSFMQGHITPDKYRGTTLSKKTAEEWAKKSEMNYFRINKTI